MILHLGDASERPLIGLDELALPGDGRSARAARWIFDTRSSARISASREDTIGSGRKPLLVIAC